MAGAPCVWNEDASPGASAVPVAFEVHEPSPTFSKRRLGAPAFYVFVAVNGGHLPAVHDLAALLEACDGVPIKAAVVAGDGTVLLFDITSGVPDARTATRAKNSKPAGAGS